MHRQPQLNGSIEVVGDAAQQGLFERLPVATLRHCPAKPTLGDRDKGLGRQHWP